MAVDNANLDIIPLNNTPSFYLNEDLKNLDGLSYLRKITEKAHELFNKNTNYHTYGIVVYSIQTMYPQSVRNRILAMYQPGPFREYKVVLEDTGLYLEDPYVLGGGQNAGLNLFKCLASEFFPCIEEEEIPDGTRVVVSFIDDERNDGWITGILGSSPMPQQPPAPTNTPPAESQPTAVAYTAGARSSRTEPIQATPDAALDGGYETPNGSFSNTQPEVAPVEPTPEESMQSE